MYIVWLQHFYMDVIIKCGNKRAREKGGHWYPSCHDRSHRCWLFILYGVIFIMNANTLETTQSTQFTRNVLILINLNLVWIIGDQQQQQQATAATNNNQRSSDACYSQQPVHSHIHAVSLSSFHSFFWSHTFVRLFCFFLWSDYIYFVAFVILIIVVTAHTAPKTIIQPTNKLRFSTLACVHTLLFSFSRSFRKQASPPPSSRTISNLLSEQLKSLNK